MEVIAELNIIRNQTYSKMGKSYFGQYKTVDEYDSIINEYKEQQNKSNINELNYQLSQYNDELKQIDSELYHLLFVFNNTDKEEEQLYIKRKEITDKQLDLLTQIDEYKGIDRVINNAIKEKQFVIKVNQKIDEMKPVIEQKYSQPNQYITNTITDLFDRYITDLTDIILEIFNETSPKYAKSMTDYVKRHINLKRLNNFVSHLKSLSNSYINSCTFNKEFLNSIIDKTYNTIYGHWQNQFVVKFEDILELCMDVSSNITNIKEANNISSNLVRRINNQFEEEGKFYNLFNQYIDEYKEMLEKLLNEYIDKTILNNALNELVPKSNKIEQFIKSLPTEYTSIDKLITLYENIVGETITNTDIGKMLKRIDGIEYKRKKINKKLVSMYRLRDN